MKIKNYDFVRDQIRSKLSDYLASHGILHQANFTCINPQHEDKNPSCGVLQDKMHFHCLSCGFTGDIFDACHFLEGKANSGPSFVTDNLMYLAGLFSIAVESTVMTSEEIYELDTFRAYDAAAKLVNNGIKDPNFSQNTMLKRELSRRGWDVNKLPADVGYTPYKEYLIHELTTKGFTPKFLQEIGLDKPELFDGDKILFTIRDHHGRAVGFAARNLTWVPGSNLPKFINTATENTIYQKGKRLYNLSNVLPLLKNGVPLYIMEGYGDVLTAWQHGMQNCCALGGTALTSDHILLLRELGIENVVLCLDGDKAGQDKTAKILDTKLAGHTDISVKVVNIPEELDPDDFIRKYSIAEFRQLTPWSAFEWRLRRFQEDEDPDAISEQMIKFIVSESSFITQETYCKALSKYTGISLKAIQSEVSRLQNEHSRKVSQERSLILDKLLYSIEKQPEDAETILNEGISNLHNLSKKYDEDKLSGASCRRSLKEQRIAEENKSDEFAGFILGPDLKQLQDALCGEWKKDVLMVFGGKANAGKTSYLTKIGYEIAAHEENDAVVIYHSIDDTFDQVLPKWICIAEGTRNLSINQVRNPKYWKTQGFDDILARRDTGYNIIDKLMSEERIVIKDANDGITLAYAESIIRYYKDKYPTRNVVYVLDNFHKLRDFAESEESERTRFKTMSNVIKNMAVKYHIPILCTMEYTKLPAGTKPTNNNIAETVQIEYDANLIAHLYNEAHELGIEQADAGGLTHNFSSNGQVHKLPIVEVYIGKNKISDFKNRIFFDFFPASSDFLSRDTSQVEAKIEEKKKEAAANKPKKPNIFSN